MYITNIYKTRRNVKPGCDSDLAPYYLNLRDLPAEGGMKSWFAKRQPLIAGRNGNMAVDEAFDGLVLFRIVHPSRPEN